METNKKRCIIFTASYYCAKDKKEITTRFSHKFNKFPSEKVLKSYVKNKREYATNVFIYSICELSEEDYDIYLSDDIDF